jgi:hypothetical protein
MLRSLRMRNRRREFVQYIKGDEEFRAQYRYEEAQRWNRGIKIGRVIFVALTAGLAYLYFHDLWLRHH